MAEKEEERGMMCEKARFRPRYAASVRPSVGEEREGRGRRRHAACMTERVGLGWGVPTVGGLTDGRGRGQTADGGQANRAEGLVIFVERKMIHSLYECSTNQRA